jgi:hypothetical protein
MMTPRGFITDEGWHAMAVRAQAMRRVAYQRKMAQLICRTPRAVPYLGHLVVAAAKPRAPATQRG